MFRRRGRRGGGGGGGAGGRGTAVEIGEPAASPRIPDDLEAARDLYVAQLSVACSELGAPSEPGGGAPGLDPALPAFVRKHPPLVALPDAESGRTLLHLAVVPDGEGTIDMELVRSLLELGADATHADAAGRTPLHIAADAAVSAADEPAGRAGAAALAAQMAGGGFGDFGGDGRVAAAQITRLMVMRGVPCPAFGEGANPAAEAHVLELVSEFNRLRSDLWGFAESGNVSSAAEMIQSAEVRESRYAAVTRPPYAPPDPVPAPCAAYLRTCRGSTRRTRTRV